MTRSVNRQIKKAKGRKALQLANHIEALGSAFCREVGIPPTEACLMSELVVPTKPLETDDAGEIKRLQVERHVTRYWYERKPEALVISEELHPDIRALLVKVQLLVQAYNAKEGETVRNGFRDIEELMSTWETPTDVVPVQSGPDQPVSV